MIKESVHKTISGVALIEVIAGMIDVTNLARIVAPNSSTRGVDCFLMGAIRVLDAMRFTSPSPLLCSVLRYTTAANALSEASQNL